MPLTEVEVQEYLDRWIDKHGVHCYYCHALVDERECFPADDFNGNDGGEICPRCYQKIQEIITQHMKGEAIT